MEILPVNYITMNEKIKCFGKYLGCQAVWIRLNKSTKFEVTPINIHIFCNTDVYPEDQIKLILKDLKDISEEDKKGLIELHGTKVEFKQYSVEMFVPFRPDQTDFLRSKGYKVGDIPNEYYIIETK